MADMRPSGSFQLFLQQEFYRRQRRNRRYSLRAFARDLQLSPSTLSEILNHRHRPLPVTIAKICQQLELPASDEEYWSWLGHHEVAPGRLLAIECSQVLLPQIHQMLTALANCVGSSVDNGQGVVLDVFQRQISRDQETGNCDPQDLSP